MPTTTRTTIAGWFPYADFITLLFAFFVVMYAISSVNAGKYRVLSRTSIRPSRSPISGGALPIGSEPQALSDPQDGRKPNLIAPDLRPLPTPPMRPDQRPVLDRSTGPDRQTPPLARPVPENAHAEQPQPGAPPVMPASSSSMRSPAPCATP